MPDGIFFPPVDSARFARTVYMSTPGSDVNCTGTTQMSMLPNNLTSGLSSFVITAGSMPVGAYLRLEGSGLIGARLTTPPGFNFVPWVTPAGGSKTTLPGFAKAPLLGADGYCQVRLDIEQTASGLRTSGTVNYWTDQVFYGIPINPGTGSGSVAGTLPSVIVSDPAVDRTFGVDGFWGSGADTREYVRCRQVRVLLFSSVSLS